MQQNPNDVAIPATVTISGETLFGIVAALLASFDLYLDDMERCETYGSSLLDNTICDLYSLAFGDFLRECEFGEPATCQCPVCGIGLWEDTHTALYLLAEKQGEEKKREWLTPCAA